ncbi:MAG: S24 family peptidase [Chloroflexota bacterium]
MSTSIRPYYVLKAVGESMNNASPVTIRNGDYILMVQQQEAVNGDIVAVEILGDRFATLKRYRFERGKHVFRPESNHPDFQVPIPAPHGFLIRGVAIALLEPEDKSEI